MTLPARFARELLTARMVDPSSGIVVALSGGPDSTALLHLVLEASIPPERVLAAHLDHSLRPGSPEDAAFVAAQADRAAVRLRSRRLDVAELARGSGMGLEAVARTERYHFLEEVALTEGFACVLTAHHQNDQAETLLLRLLRGTGPPGLAGILPDRPIRPGSPVRLTRPLLPFSRQEILRYLRDRGIPWVEDATNLDGSNARSLVRSRLLPWLEDGSPSCVPRLARAADLARDLGRRWEALGAARIPADGSSLLLPSGSPPPPALLRARLRALLPPGGPPLDRASIRRLLAAFSRGRGLVDLGRGWTARIDERGGRVTVLPPGAREASPPRTVLSLLCPGEVPLPDGSVIACRRASTPTVSLDPFTETLDADGARRPPYRVRYAREGDRFRPLGYPARTTVYRFLMARGVPRLARRHTPVVLGSGGVLWVVGHRIGEEARTRPGTGRMVRLTSRREVPPPPSARPLRPL